LDPIPVETLIENNGRLYDGKDRDTRRRLSSQELHELSLVDEEGNEIPLYDSRGTQIPRRSVVQNVSKPPCGVLVNLKSIQGLFNPDNSAIILEDTVSASSEYEDLFVRVEAYPLAFLKMAGNVKASGVPHCFYPLLTKINKSVRKNHEAGHPSSSNRQGGEDPGEVDLEAPYLDSTYRAVKPVSSQFYNYMTHRVASRAGRHDAQQGSVTAAISGAYANDEKDEKVAKEKQKYCKNALPSDRFHARMTSVRECPNACRAELVYSVDVRALKDRSGSYVFLPPLSIARSLSLSMSAEC
jgi:hypothetical protein